MATTTVSAAVTRLLASADLSAVTVKTLVAQVREQLPDVGAMGDKPLRRAVREAVEAYLATDKKTVLSVARLRDVEAKATRLRQMLADKAGMGDDPLKAGRAELAAAKREVERRDLLGGLDSGNIVSGGRRRRGAPVSYTDPAPADMLDKLLEEEEERAYAQDSAAVAGEKKPTGKPAVGRRVLGDGSNEEDADTAGAKQDKTAEPSGEVGAPAAEADSAVVDNEPVRGQEADGKAPQSAAVGARCWW
ncbi:hypothetical protein I4F81_010432 [Pyropia yezoensis]|uniref:Uncharacterized protein n=1 Tax=Pyropia yezoensis TaxID=2788 RepID=A0ACC3CD94_PYRYE|nr:hypothetical protein I4F81_010432 [Neopyropia yezoensis]